MKKILVLMSVLLLILMLLGGNGCTFTIKNTEGYSTFQKYGTIQGKIMDAITGSSISGKDLNMYLISGINNRKPDKLIVDENDPLAGEYAFSKIPVEINDGDLTFKVIAIKPGYQRFEANISIDADFDFDYPVTDELFNCIDNIYLYPLNASSGNVTAYVYSPQGVLIPNATVLLKQDVTNNNTVSYTGNRLLPAAGLYPSLSATTDANGKAVFSGADLVLGGSYSITVEPLIFAEQQLAITTSASFINGVASSTRIINMTLIGNSLYVVTASNSVPGTITADGTLSIVFNKPIALSTNVFTASINGGGVLASTSVTGVLSDNNTKLTLTPTITTAPTTKGATISYSYAGTIYLRDTQTATTYTLFAGVNNVRNITTGNSLSGIVQLLSN